MYNKDQAEIQTNKHIIMLSMAVWRVRFIDRTYSREALVRSAEKLKSDNICEEHNALHTSSIKLNETSLNDLGMKTSKPSGPPVEVWLIVLLRQFIERVCSPTQVWMEEGHVNT